MTLKRVAAMALEVKKMKQGMSYSCKEKTIILNVFKYFRVQYPDQCVTEIVRRTAKATGCSEKSIFQFRKEEASAEGFKVPSTTKVRRNVNINSRDIKYGSAVRLGIRNIIYDLKYRNIVPSLSTILRQVNGDQGLPDFSLMTLRRLLFDMGFSYEKNGTKSLLVEKPMVKKENGKGSKKQKAAEVRAQVPPVQQEAKPPPLVPVLQQVNQPMQMCHEQRFVQQQQQQLDNRMLPPPPQPQPMHIPHNVPMMLNHRVQPHPHSMPPPYPVSMHAKHEIAPWIPTHHNIMKQ